MLSPSVIFTPTTGPVVAALEAGFGSSGQAYAAGVQVEPVRPKVFPKRLVTVRNDGGPNELTLSRRRTGINVWGESPLIAEQIALLAGAILATTRTPFFVTDVSSPYPIEETPDVTAGDGTVLSHFYFTCTVVARAANF